MKRALFLGIDTSNYTTSAALVDDDRTILLNSKHPLPVREGERGLRQSDALFHHVKNLPDAAADISRCIAEYGDEIQAIGFSKTPRDVEGSYMPCFLAGQSSAAMASALLHIPAYPFSHQAGHIMAALVSAVGEKADDVMCEPFLAFHVSGGTTDLLLCEPDPERIFRITQIGGTRDINAGQAIDRTGVRMGLSFPCGAAMDAAAMELTAPIRKPKLSVDGTWCNLSGLENKAAALYEETGDVAGTSAYTLDFIAGTLEQMTINAIGQYGKLPVLYAGGVMSSRTIRRTLSPYGFFAEAACSSDNAVGVALLAREQVQKEMKHG